MSGTIMYTIYVYCYRTRRKRAYDGVYNETDSDKLMRTLKKLFPAHCYEVTKEPIESEIRI
jgi:hypothetical protein